VLEPLTIARFYTRSYHCQPSFRTRKTELDSNRFINGEVPGAKRERLKVRELAIECLKSFRRWTRRSASVAVLRDHMMVGVRAVFVYLAKRLAPDHLLLPDSVPVRHVGQAQPCFEAQAGTR
jgi:hypothetical protein